jgi:hypothetical protein
MSTTSEEMRYSSEEDEAEKKRMMPKTSWITTSSRCAPTRNNKMALYTDSKAGIGSWPAIAEDAAVPPRLNGP